MNKNSPYLLPLGNAVSISTKNNNALEVIIETGSQKYERYYSKRNKEVRKPYSLQFLGKIDNKTRYNYLFCCDKIDSFSDNMELPVV